MFRGDVPPSIQWWCTSCEDEGVISGWLIGDDDDSEELIGYVAAEANHEQDCRRQKRLDAAFAVLNDALDEPPISRRDHDPDLGPPPTTTPRRPRAGVIVAPQNTAHRRRPIRHVPRETALLLRCPAAWLSRPSSEEVKQTGLC